MRNLVTQHRVASSQADAMQQWFNAGGMINFYDWDLDSYLNVSCLELTMKLTDAKSAQTTKELVANGSVSLKTLQSHVRNILGVKWDLGLFKNAFIADDIDPLAIVASHQNVALEAAQKSIVLLKNDNNTLPLDATRNTRVALIGPFADTLNFGDYAGALGQYPVKYAGTLREGMLKILHLAKGSATKLKSSWGANSWEYNNQYVIPPYLLSTNGSAGGFKATYYADTNFTTAQESRTETPAQDWGLYPPPGLSSNNFSAVWEGQLESPVDTDINGWIGLATGPNSTARLFIDGRLTTSREYSAKGNLLGNIQGYEWTQQNSTLPPKDGAQFRFRHGRSYHIRIEFQSWNTNKKTANVNSVNSQLVFWWNLVSPNGGALEEAISIAKDSDILILAVGAAWNSDGESGDRATLSLAPSQDKLVESLLDLGKPVVLVLEGGRPFAIPEYYKASSAVLSTSFGGQAAGQAIADVLFGKFNPGGRLPVSVPYHVGQVPVYYNYKPSARAAQYLDIPTDPFYPFGYGLSYSTFSVPSFSANVVGEKPKGLENGAGRLSNMFRKGDLIIFTASITNNGAEAGSYVAQVYLLGRVSSITQPVKQLVVFERIYLYAKETKTVSMELEVDRYLQIINRKGGWELEKGDYVFALSEHGGSNADVSTNITLTCAG